MEEKFYSQDKQDSTVEGILKGHRNGFFVDVGAHDGVSLNNTLFFEKYRGWKGLNIEPIESVYNKLVINRPNCFNLKCAVSNVNGEAEFICNQGSTEMLSGLKDQYDPRHSTRLNNENSWYGGSTSVIKVPTLRLETIFDVYNIKHINYLSIDVEGAELEVVKSINFDKVFIDLIGFENNYPDSGEIVKQFLIEKGFEFKLASWLDVFMINSKSQFKSS